MTKMKKVIREGRELRLVNFKTSMEIASPKLSIDDVKLAEITKECGQHL